MRDSDLAIEIFFCHHKRVAEVAARSPAEARRVVLAARSLRYRPLCRIEPRWGPAAVRAACEVAAEKKEPVTITDVWHPRTGFCAYLEEATWYAEEAGVELLEGTGEPFKGNLLRRYERAKAAFAEAKAVREAVDAVTGDRMAALCASFIVQPPQ